MSGPLSLRDALIVAQSALKNCDELFADIRGDWTDPRYQCRSGRSQCEAALALIEEALQAEGLR